MKYSLGRGKLSPFNLFSDPHGNFNHKVWGILAQFLPPFASLTLVPYVTFSSTSPDLPYCQLGPELCPEEACIRHGPGNYSCVGDDHRERTSSGGGRVRDGGGRVRDGGGGRVRDGGGGRVRDGGGRVSGDRVSGDRVSGGVRDDGDVIVAGLRKRVI